MRPDGTARPVPAARSTISAVLVMLILAPAVTVEVAITFPSNVLSDIRPAGSTALRPVVVWACISEAHGAMHVGRSIVRCIITMSCAAIAVSEKAVGGAATSIAAIIFTAAHLYPADKSVIVLNQEVLS